MVPCTDNGVDGVLRSTTAISFFIRMQFTRDCARRPRPTESSLHVLDLANTSQRYRREPRMILLAQGYDVPHRSTTALASSRHGTSRSRGRSPINLSARDLCGLCGAIVAFRRLQWPLAERIFAVTSSGQRNRASPSRPTMCVLATRCY